MKRKLFTMILSILIAAATVLFAGCGTIFSGSGASSTSSTSSADAANSNHSGTAEATTAVTAEDAEDNKVDITGDFTIVTEDGTVTNDGNVWTITSAGEYTATGSLPDGQIVVAAGDDDAVTLVLAGASITCSTDSPILIQSADKVNLKVEADTYNEVNDTRALQTDENDATGSAAIYAKCDLDVKGKGSLVVTATYNNGIHTKDDLEIKNLTLKVTAPNNALKGNDSLTVESGEIIAISTSGDALKTENSDVSSKGNQRGTITISGGTLTLFAGCDGIDAAYNVEISGDVNLTINTNRYSSYTVSSLLKTASATSAGSGRFGGRDLSQGNTNASVESSKGIKADNEIVVSGGTIVINCMDDGIHANSDVTLENGATPLGNVTVNGGSITITAADDGIHADGTLTVSDGYIDVVTSWEGLEGHLINFEGGEAHVFGLDDGVNATSTGNGSNGLITVSGGFLTAEVSGGDVDGIDANGSYKQTGGIVVVSNPNANSNGTAAAVDADGTVTVTGGILVALGTVPSGGGMGGGRMGMGGMSSSNVPSGSVTFSGTLAAGDHTFTYGDTTVTFTLKNKVSSGWIWASGISSSNYTLK